MTSPDQSVVSVEYRGRVAVLTIDNQRKLNALSGFQYHDLAQKMREVAARDEVVVTVLTAKGRFFSAGADVSISRSTPDQSTNAYEHWLRAFVANNLDVTRAFYTHPKILVVGLNGPVVGLSAALAAHADFVYATPKTYLLTPFSSLGLLAEGGSSRALVRRLGVARANEALLMSKRLSCDELVAAGFVNAVFDEGDDAAFRERLLREVDDRLGEHLDGGSLLGTKRLIQGPESEAMDLQNMREHFGGLERFVQGIPQEEFRKLASGEKRHKL